MKSKPLSTAEKKIRRRNDEINKNASLDEISVSFHLHGPYRICIAFLTLAKISSKLSKTRLLLCICKGNSLSRSFRLAKRAAADVPIYKL